MYGYNVYSGPWGQNARMAQPPFNGQFGGMNPGYGQGYGWGQGQTQKALGQRVPFLGRSGGLPPTYFPNYLGSNVAKGIGAGPPGENGDGGGGTGWVHPTLTNRHLTVNSPVNDAPGSGRRDGGGSNGMIHVTPNRTNPLSVNGGGATISDYYAPTKPVDLPVQFNLVSGYRDPSPAVSDRPTGGTRTGGGRVGGGSEDVLGLRDSVRGTYRPEGRGPMRSDGGMWSSWGTGTSVNSPYAAGLGYYSNMFSPGVGGSEMRRVDAPRVVDNIASDAPVAFTDGGNTSVASSANMVAGNQQAGGFNTGQSAAKAAGPMAQTVGGVYGRGGQSKPIGVGGSINRMGPLPGGSAYSGQGAK